MSALLIWGSGGHAKVVLDIARADGRFSAIACINDDEASERAEFSGCRILGSFHNLSPSALGGYDAMVIAIGSNQARAHCFEIAREHGWTLVTLVHSSAVISPSARLGAGTVVMPRAVVNASATVGENCIINSAAVVEHDCHIADHAHLSPGVMLGGGVTIQRFAHLGLGAIALPGSTIGERAVVGAGAVVLRSVEADQTVVGVPCHRLGKRPTALRGIGGSR